MKNSEEKKLFILVGTPLSGKSTWIRNNYSDTIVISRDEIVMDCHGSRLYNDAFKSVNHKEVDKILEKRMTEMGKSNENVIIDMTNMNPKRRIRTLSYFKKHKKIAIIFPILSEIEYERRNNERLLNENKWISTSIINSMIDLYIEPSKEEGFDEIIKL